MAERPGPPDSGNGAQLGRTGSSEAAGGSKGAAIGVADGLPARRGRQGLDGEGVDITFQHIIQGRVYQAVPGDRGHTPKCLGYDPYPIVAVAARRARMAGMKVTFIVDYQLNRGEPGDQFFAQPPFSGRLAHEPRSARASRVLPLSHMTCGIMKTSIAALMPKTLKLTQTPSAKFRAI